MQWCAIHEVILKLGELKLSCHVSWSLVFSNPTYSLLLATFSLKVLRNDKKNDWCIRNGDLAYLTHSGGVIVIPGHRLWGVEVQHHSLTLI